MRLNLRRLGKILSCLLMIAALVLPAIGTGVARADPTWTQTSQADFESGTLFQVDTSSSPGDVKLDTVGAGSNSLYALRGNYSKDFWRYDISVNSWTSLANTLARVKYGGALAGDGSSYIYAFRGDNRDDFWRYDIAANSWASKTDAPGTVKEGGALTYDGSGYIYALRGDNSKDFWRYDTSANSWTSLANTHDNVKEGGALTCDGGNYVYAFQCVDTETFWRYDISADNWTLMADTPSSAGYGAALTYDGSSYIYALRGKHSNSFWRYDISADSWSVMANAPGYAEWGGALAHDGSSYIYALRGDNSKNFWRYDISADSWTSRADTPGKVKYGGALTMGGESYHDSGNLTSSAHDTGYSANFGTISWMVTTPTSTEIKFQIATNNDNATWNFKGPDGGSGTYYTSSGTGIWSGHDNDRYIKYRALLGTTDSCVTPTLHDVSITYSQQVVLPSVTTGNATLVEETTATLHGTVTDDGGEACQYRFQWGTTQGGPYTDNTTWTGSKTTGQSFSAAITGLSKGTKYYFIAEAKNSAGIDNGTELSFLTKPDPPNPFTATAVSGTQIDLTWTKGEGTERTMVRRKTGGYPTGITDGDEVYFDTGNSTSDTGLSPDTTYYYAAWSEVTGSQQWSDAYAAATTTTGSEPPPPPPTAVGGTVYPVNKVQVLAPWFCLLLVLSLAVGRVVFSLRQGRSLLIRW